MFHLKTTNVCRKYKSVLKDVETSKVCCLSASSCSNIHCQLSQKHNYMIIREVLSFQLQENFLILYNLECQQANFWDIM